MDDSFASSSPTDGNASAPVGHFRRPVERPFTRDDRERVTILFGGGLTRTHDRLIQAALESLGYRMALIPVPTKADCQTGKEYGNNGQCNPMLFGTGALINFLRRLRDEQGMPTERILSDYVFVTAGACGPCRFGMYEAEYRLALRNAGFDGFRVILFKVTRGLSQAAGGLEMNTVFFLGLLNGIMMGDLLTELAHQIRAYAVDPAQAEAALDECVEMCEEDLRGRDHTLLRRGLLARLLGRIAPPTGPADGAALLDQIRGPQYLGVFERCRRLLDEQVEVDFTRSRPVVKVVGEFWAQLTEGDGNFRMFSFLEGEGAEVRVEPVTTWINYLAYEARTRFVDRRGFEGPARPGFREFRERFRRFRNNRLATLALAAGEAILRRTYERLRVALGGTAHALVPPGEWGRLAHPYYHSRAAGGEGHLEVAKNIYYHSRGMAHMVVSLKPFGCMPSTQSDGAQAGVMARYPEVNFLPIETSGEGEINARSRVQMALGEAKARCKAELRECLDGCRYSLDEIRAYVAAHRELRRPLLHFPHVDGVAGRAASFVRFVAARMDRERDAVRQRRGDAVERSVRPLPWGAPS